MPAQISDACDFDDFVEGILDDTGGQSGRNIGYFRALFLCLLDVGIHKDGTTGAEIGWLLCIEPRFGEVPDIHPQRVGKCFEERTASGRAGFIELDGVDGPILDADAFHILSADIENAVDLRVEKGSRIVVGNGLDFALVQAEGRFQKGFSISGGTTVRNGHVVR